MKTLLNNTSLSTICTLFGKSREAWYDAYGRKDHKEMEEELILSWVREIRDLLPITGTVKLLHMLQENFANHGIRMGRDALNTLLTKHNLLIEPKKRYVVTTNSHHHYRRWANMIKRVNAYLPEQIWVSDITYLRIKSKFIYLFLITDAYSRKIVGYHLSQTLEASGCVLAIEKAIKERIYPQRPLIHHSDRGIQYCCNAYVSFLRRCHVAISMTQSGSPYDNAIAERVNGVLKAEFGLYCIFENYSQAVDPVCKAIAKYNYIRPHLSCQLSTPQAKHISQNNLMKQYVVTNVKFNPYGFYRM